MRGKKTDPIFVTQFISECVKDGLTTPDEIVKRARQQLDQIDLEIKTIENKKKIRGQLLDVVASFEKQTKDKTKEADTLSFYDLSNYSLCKSICDRVVFGPHCIDEIDMSYEMCFTIKQLIEHKIIDRDVNMSGHIIRGERYDEYMQFIICGNK